MDAIENMYLKILLDNSIFIKDYITKDKSQALKEQEELKKSLGTSLDVFENTNSLFIIESAYFNHRRNKLKAINMIIYELEMLENEENLESYIFIKHKECYDNLKIFKKYFDQMVEKNNTDLVDKEILSHMIDTYLSAYFCNQALLKQAERDPDNFLPYVLYPINLDTVFHNIS